MCFINLIVSLNFWWRFELWIFNAGYQMNQIMLFAASRVSTSTNSKQYSCSFSHLLRLRMLLIQGFFVESMKRHGYFQRCGVHSWIKYNHHRKCGNPAISIRQAMRPSSNHKVWNSFCLFNETSWSWLNLPSVQRELTSRDCTTQNTSLAARLKLATSNFKSFSHICHVIIKRGTNKSAPSEIDG